MAIAAYLGSGTAFDTALVTFAETYAVQNRRDFDAFAAAIKRGRLESVDEQ